MREPNSRLRHSFLKKYSLRIYIESEREREAKAHVLQKHTLRKPIETH